MPNYTIQDLAWMKGVPVPVREALFSLEQQLTASQAREAELLAHVERLREALEKLDGWLYERNLIGLMPQEKEILVSTPEQSLARYRNEVLEEVLDKVDRQHTWITTVAVHALIRAMKEPE